MTARKYESPVREAQLEETRERLFAVARELLTQGGLDALTLPRLAQAAGVSVPTVYRHFPTMDALIEAFLVWIRPLIGQTRERLMTAPASLPELPSENFARFEEHGAVLRPLMESRAFNRVRVASMRDRARQAAELLAGAAPGWRGEELEAMSGAIWVLASPQTWRWLVETWGLETKEAARAASWAMGALLEALGRGPAEPPAEVRAKRAKQARATTAKAKTKTRRADR
ncbi:MAG: TetR/AcrR family transcriptional regulator [Deltaproteobacteria bacterium]|nr:TetR/AcrR family transcriptional regulator [Deltaproteobacteria bacterium]